MPGNNGSQKTTFWPQWPENKLFTVLLGILLTYLTVWVGGQIRNNFKAFQFIGKPSGFRDTLSIDGEGKVIARPDIATTEIGVMTEKKDVMSAQNENTAKMNAIVAKLKALEIADQDIKTANYFIYPQYDYPEGKQVLRGYQVNQTIGVKIRDLAKIGSVLQVATESGANQVSGISFTIDEPTNLKTQAREKALTSAKVKADTVANRLGVRLGKVISYSEYVPSPAPSPYFSRMAEGVGGGGEMPKIEAGSQEVQVNVTVGYEIL